MISPCIFGYPLVNSHSHEKWPINGLFIVELPSGYLTVRHGIDGPFIDDFPSYKPPFMVGIFHGYVSHHQMVPVQPGDFPVRKLQTFTRSAQNFTSRGAMPSHRPSPSGARCCVDGQWGQIATDPAGGWSSWRNWGCYLVGGAIITILKHIKVNGKDYPIYIYIMEKHVWKQQPVMICYMNLLDLTIRNWNFIRFESNNKASLGDLMVLITVKYSSHKLGYTPINMAI